MADVRGPDEAGLPQATVITFDIPRRGTSFCSPISLLDVTLRCDERDLHRVACSEDLPPSGSSSIWLVTFHASDKFESIDILEDVVVCDKWDVEPQRRRCDPSVGLVHLLAERVAAANASRS